MKKIVTLLLILTVVGILWLVSRYWEFSSETYVNDKVRRKAQIYGDTLDFNYIKQEFEPAYEF